MVLSTIRSLALAAIILIPTRAMAQISAPPGAAPSAPLLKLAELDQLVASVALYTDPLLAHVLMASAYPCLTSCSADDSSRLRPWGLL